MKQQRGQKTAVGTKKKAEKTGLSRHPFVVPLATFLILFLITLLGFIFIGSETVGPTDKRLVNVYVDGELQTVPTRAKTVSELLDRLGIEVSKKDTIEPSLDAPIDSDNFAVNVYRARQVTVVDQQNNTEVAIISAHQEPRDIATEAGVKLYPEDIVQLSEPGDVYSSGITERIMVSRAVPVQLNLYGKVYKIRTHAKTVQELMQERGVTYDAESVLPSLATVLTSNEVVFVANPDKEIKRKESSIAFEEIIRQDPALETGETKVVEAGRKGRKVVIYSIDKKGKRTVLQTVVVRKPVDRIVVKGSKVPTVAITSNKAELLSAAGVPTAQHFAADFIIGRESGWRLNAQNAGGCLGLGQACPGSKLVAACPAWQTDAACQIKFFTGYAKGRYGSWSGAYQAWQIQGWW